MKVTRLLKEYCTIFVQAKDILELKVAVNTKIKFSTTAFGNHQLNKTMSTEEIIVRSPHKDIDIPNKTFTDLIWERHEKWKNNIAVFCGLTSEQYTFSELREISKIVGSGLLRQGFKPQQVVAVLLLNSPQYVTVILGAAEYGITICSINPLYTPDEIAYQIKNCGAVGIITQPEKLNDVLKATGDLSEAETLPNNFKVIATRSLDGKDKQLPTSVLSLDEIIKTTREKGCKKSVLNLATSLAFIAHSSGTTGLPKGVSLTHKNVTSSILQMAHHPITIFQETTDKYQDVIPMVLPIFHNFGLEIILDALYHGSKIVTLPKFEETLFLSTLEEQKATMLFAVPPMLLFIGSNSAARKDHLKHLRCIFTAAAPIGYNDIMKCLSKAPRNVNFINGYGQTEAMCLLTHTPYGEKNFKSVGIPIANTEIKVIDLQTGMSLKEGEEGEICFRGPQMSLGYLNNSKATDEALDKDGWFHTGDIGYYNTDRHFYIVDRIKEMIKVKGYQVAPAELEAVLRSHPDVLDAAVIGTEDKRKGEVPVGFVKCQPGTKPSPENLTDFLSKRVAPFKIIEKFFFLDSIPRSASGKILRKDLKISLDKVLNKKLNT